MSTVQGLRYEVRPGDALPRLLQHTGLHRFVFNTCLAAVKANLGQRAAERSYGVAEGDLTPVLGWSAPALEAYWRRVRGVVAPWFEDEKLSSRVPKEACRALAVALSNWSKSRKGARAGRRVGFPRFKSLRKSGRVFHVDSARVKPLDARRITIPNVGVVSSMEDLSWLTDRVAAGTAAILGTAIREQAGRWWVTFKVRVDREVLNAARVEHRDGPAVGVDVGLSVFATIVDEHGRVSELDAPKPLKVAQRRLRRLNKELARREFDRATKKSSARREKTRKKLARAHLDVANKRKDFLHKTTTHMARTNPVIVVETLNVAGMVKNHRLARAIHDVAWAEFVRQLEYKTTWYGSRLVQADRWMPSSKTCSNCANVKPVLGLSTRVYECDSCGHIDGRDVNAARNLLKLAA